MNTPRLGLLILLLCSGTIAGVASRPTIQESGVDSSPFELLPVFGSDTAEYIGLSLTNTAPVVNEVAVTWTDADGNWSRTGFLSLAPGSQHSALVSEILEAPEGPPAGWIRIDSSQAGLFSYMTSGRDGILDGSEPASHVSRSILLSHIAIDTGFMELEHTDTLAHLINPGAVPGMARVVLFGLDGLPVGELTIPIPARACRTFRISEAFREMLPPNHLGGRIFQGYMRVFADVGLAGWLRIDTPLSRRLLRGRAAEEIVPERLMMVSHLVSGGNALYRSELNLIHAGNTAVTLELTLQDNRGVRIGQDVQRTLGPGQALREDVLRLFQVVVPEIYPPPMIDGYIRIRAADGGMFQATGDINITCRDSAASMLYPMAPASSFDAILPFVINDLDYFTGYAIANPNEMLTVQLDIRIELYDRDGRLVGTPRSVSLSPAARFVSLIEEKARSGYLRIYANGPFTLLGSIGTRSVSLLAPLPVY